MERGYLSSLLFAEKINFKQLMEKARYTLFQSRSWVFLALTLVCVCFSSLTINAQKEVLIKSDSSSIEEMLTECNDAVTTSSPVQFLDDGSNDGNYADDYARADTATFCPSDQWHRVKVVFTDFDVAPGDTLFAFQGNLAELNAATAAAIAAAANTAAAALNGGIAGVADSIANSITIPGDATEADLEALVEANADSAAVAAAIEAGFFDSPIDLTNPAALAEAIIAFKALQQAVQTALGSVALNDLPGTTGASDGTGTGVGVGATTLASARSVSDAFGGWIDASCDPAVNASGCLTFIFETNGDRAKGTGWDAWVDCEAREISLSGVTIADVRLECADLPSTMITLPAPDVAGCDGATLQDSVFLRVQNQNGDVCIDEMLAKTPGGLPDNFVGQFGVGQYIAVYKLMSDTSKTLSVPFSVQSPALTCNDEVNTVFGAACQLSITPDMVLEDPCDTSANLSYTINFKLGTTVVATGTVANPPVISQDSLVSAGGAACNGELTVEIIRTITAPAGICSNDPEVVTCSTTLKYTDNTAPVFAAHTASVDTLIQADTVGITALIDKPDATDNCGTVNVVSSIHSVLNGAGTAAADAGDICAYPIKVVIQHVAVDECNNSSNALTDTVFIMRPFEFTTPGIDSLECNADDPGYLASGAPRLRVGTFTNGAAAYTGSLAVDTLNYTAGYILRYTDQVIDDSDCGSKVFRAYSFVDWCDDTPGLQPIGTQFIHYFDQSAPEFTYTGADTEEAGATKIDLDFGECTKAISPTAPSAIDGCDTDPTVAMFAVMQKVNGTYTKIGDNLEETGALGCDTFRLRYRVYDDCHTQTVEDSIDRYFILQDVEYPVVTCEDEVYVSVSNSAGVVMEASTFYKTATDNCGTPTVRIRRQLQAENGGGYGPWGTSILVECNALVRDVNHNSFNVEVEVTDKNGRTNRCWVKVTPEDKIAPICNDLEDDITRTCDEFHNGELGKSTDTDGDGEMETSEWVVLDKDDAELDALRKLFNTEFGTPVCTDNLDECGAIEITQSYQLIEDGCGVIRIKRRWSATDWGAQGGVNTSQAQEQSILISYKQDWTLTFPADKTLTCGEDGVPAPATYDEIVRSGACDNIALNITADTFRTPGETCMKIIRNYTIINDCIDGDATYVVTHNENGAKVEDEDVADNFNKFTYSQVIKLDVSEGGIIVEQNSAEINTCIIGIGDAAPFGEEDKGLFDGVYECDTVRTFTATATNCLGIPLTKFSHRVTVDGAEIANADGATVTVPVEPGKTYSVTFVAFDDCNNSNSSTETYTFKDCKRPTPYVLNGIAIELGEGGTVDLWASDLDENSYDNCTDQDKLEMYISREKIDGGLDAIRAAGTSMTLDCNDVGTRVVYIYVVDASGNWDFVETFVLVESNIYDCIGSNVGGMVAGHIVNSNGENVEQVSVSVSGAMQESMTTGANGAFQFELTTGADYTVTPVKDMNPLNGVSTFDLVLISKHILGITTFDSPYKHIAADVNKSGSITAFDMVQLRQLILNINTEFSNNDSWRFVDADYDFSVSTVNPAAQDFAEFKNISQLADNMTNLDFVGVKIGDVNGNASANSLLGAESRTTNGTLNFNVTDRLVEAGETLTVDFTSADIATAQGYQFTMNFAGLNLTQLEEGVAKAANFNTNLLERGILTTSWNGQATANDVLFSLTFNATSTGLLSELITVNSDLTTAEAYNTSGELLDVNIEFTTIDVDFALAQNVPNPFNGETVVSFNLPTAGTATLKVMDVQGKVLKEIRGDYAKGYNQVTLKAKELTSGVLYYQLESADQVATKKIIIID